MVASPALDRQTEFLVYCRGVGEGFEQEFEEN
jgi:hypothetical protein